MMAPALLLVSYFVKKKGGVKIRTFCKLDNTIIINEENISYVNFMIQIDLQYLLV